MRVWQAAEELSEACCPPVKNNRPTVPMCLFAAGCGGGAEWWLWVFEGGVAVTRR